MATYQYINSLKAMSTTKKILRGHETVTKTKLMTDLNIKW